MRLVEFLDDIYVPLKRITERTQDLYRMTIAAYGESLGHEPTLADLDEMRIARFLAKRVRERAPATAEKDRSQLRAMWEFAARRRLVDSWPTITPVKVPERVPECWLTDEMQRLLQSAAQEKTYYDGVPAALWWRALIMLLYATGERISPALDLTWSDVRPRGILFRAETRKGSTRDIYREIDEETYAALEAIRLDRDAEAHVFPWPRCRSYVWGRLEIILRRAGLPCGRNHKFHKIRRTTASYFEAAGGDAQELLDHQDKKTTRAYLDPRVARRPSASDLIPKVS